MELNPTTWFGGHMDLHQSEGWLEGICSVWRQQREGKALGRTPWSLTLAEAGRFDVTPSPPRNAGEPKG
jgi:hypothetical protein